MSRTVSVPREVASLTLPTPFGEWDVRAFEWADSVHVCLCRGRIGDGEDVLVRMHSECLTGDALGSLRCDCGIQLRHGAALGSPPRAAACSSTRPGTRAAGSGWRTSCGPTCCRTQGATPSTRTCISGFHVDERTFGDVADVPARVGCPSVRLMSNNRDKVARPRRRPGSPSGPSSASPTAAHVRNVRYLATKQQP